MASKKKTTPSFFGRVGALLKKAFLKPPTPKTRTKPAAEKRIEKKLAPKAKKQTTSSVPKKKAIIFSPKPVAVSKKPIVARKKPARKTALKVSAKNPILSPRAEHAWEAWQTFNPGVISLDGKVHFMYRAIGNDGVSRLGYAASRDGFVIEERLPRPAFEHRAVMGPYTYHSYISGGSWGGAEDPRIVRVGDEDRLYMTYTACDGGLRVGLTSIKITDFLNKKWKWKPSVLISPPGEVHKNWVIFPEKINGKYAILHSINPEIAVEYVDNLDFKDAVPIKSAHGGKPRKQGWDKWVRGVGPIPLKTPYGWLVFYHAMDDDWGKYKVGAMLLDLNDPTQVLARAKEPVLEPTELYGEAGFKPGVVYAPGAVIKGKKLLLYYGVADSYAGVAQADFAEFIDELKKDAVPKLKARKES